MSFDIEIIFIGPCTLMYILSASDKIFLGISVPLLSRRQVYKQTNKQRARRRDIIPIYPLKRQFPTHISPDSNSIYLILHKELKPPAMAERSSEDIQNLLSNQEILTQV